jgi:hypothetical protein
MRALPGFLVSSVAFVVLLVAGAPSLESSSGQARVAQPRLAQQRIAQPQTAQPQTGKANGNVSATAPPRDIVLSGTVTRADKGTYQEHRFAVPAGVTRIDVAFDYEHQKDGSELEVGLFDPQRFRGTSRFSKSTFHVATYEATPSYLPGPIVAGNWVLSLGMPAVKADTTTTWRATIRLSFEASPRAGLAGGTGVLNAAPGWYVGDLHAHTLHSDGFGCEDAATPATKRGCQPWEVVEAARAAHLDFLAITDHNTTTHHAELAVMQEGLASLLLLRGQELTTFHGHANVYGTSRIIDFRLGFRGRSMIDVMNDVQSAGAVLSINHPGRETGDRCTGCGWDAPQTPWERIEVMEVINGGNIEGPTAGMPYWYARLNEGHHITAIGGSDDHGARSARGHIGSPATVIYARELSEAALLEGMRAGRVYVRTRGPAGPTVILTATASQAEAVQMGGTLARGAGNGQTDEPVRLRIEAAKAAGQRAEIVRNGEVVATVDVPVSAADAAARATLDYSLSLAAGQWVHVRLRDAKGITAFTNPIYASKPAPKTESKPVSPTAASPSSK